MQKKYFLITSILCASGTLIGSGESKEVEPFPIKEVAKAFDGLKQDMRLPIDSGDGNPIVFSVVRKREDKAILRSKEMQDKGKKSYRQISLYPALYRQVFHRPLVARLEPYYNIAQPDVAKELSSHSSIFEYEQAPNRVHIVDDNKDEYVYTNIRAKKQCEDRKSTITYDLKGTYWQYQGDYFFWKKYLTMSCKSRLKNESYSFEQAREDDTAVLCKHVSSSHF